MKIEARFTHDKVRHDQENTVHLALTLKAPKVDWQAKRPPICIIPVIDCSSSMSGDKIAYAKKSVLKLLEHLQPGDFIGLIKFDSEVTTIAKPVELTQTKREELKAKVGELKADGWTNFSGGMCEALEHASKLELPDGVILRVVMFTDGQANRGVAISPEDIVTLAKKARGRATISAFGYGSDANQEMLSDLAKACGGNYAFIKDPENALTAFAKELGGLLSTYAQDISIELTPHNGHRVTEVVSDVDADQADKKVTVKLPEILGEEERHVVFQMKLSEQKQALPRAMNVADIKVTYSITDENGKKSTKSEDIKAKISFVKPGDEQAKPTEAIDKIVGIAELVKAQINAEELVKRGDYVGAQAEMKTKGGLLRSRGLHAQADAAEVVCSSMASPDAYSRGASYLNSMKSAGTRAHGTSEMHEGAAAAYGAMGMNVENSLQSRLKADFVKESGASVEVDAAGSILISSPGGGSVHIKPAPAPAPAAPEPPKSVAKKRSKRW